jgi:transcriptional regulator with XRE-family HTH domain
MSRFKLAELSQISAKNIQQYETGSRAMTIDELAIIADALQIGAFHFFL